MKKTYAPILTLLISALGVLPPAAAALAQGEMALAPAAQHLQEKNLLLVVAIVDGILLLSTVALALILGIRRRRHRLDRVLARSGRAYAPGGAGKALSPVMREVAALHAKGRAHGGICAAHMTRSFTNGSGCVNHIVDNDDIFIFYISDCFHFRYFIRSFPGFMTNH